MVIVRLNFGLGNQMFQYAAGKALSLRYNRPFKIDLSAFQNQVGAQHHEKECHLNIFKADLTLATKKELEIVQKYSLNWVFRLYNRTKKVFGFNGELVYYGNNNNPSRDLENHEQGKIIYVAGDFQNEAFFKDYQDVIRDAFYFKDINQDKENYSLGKEIISRESVSIHVRRGDYVNHTIIKPVSLTYYQKAIEKICLMVQEPYFYVFSDDIDWCKKNLNLSASCTFIQHNTGKNSYKDMYLMSQCKHNIIANSSFSWWGAWLNNNPDKIVIAPNKWMLGRASTDIVPKTWILI
ncbi:MAG: alpha-1,2-fucosyltransferase [Cytophagales bacterium CG18_big_fil_WC_8_21_14_2_50_42_9]|nr:MAG: alpha-1,2-fucosyltransferase [Cytophagales bacterium CG18_big_fil_WC_8_21_14_2_50_42_9]